MIFTLGSVASLAAQTTLNTYKPQLMFLMIMFTLGSVRKIVDENGESISQWFQKTFHNLRSKTFLKLSLQRHIYYVIRG